jgi:hypothetical protein
MYYYHKIVSFVCSGRGGMAITIVTQYDIAHMHKIENKISNLPNKTQNNWALIDKMYVKFKI